MMTRALVMVDQAEFIAERPFFVLVLYRQEQGDRHVLFQGKVAEPRYD